MRNPRGPMYPWGRDGRLVAVAAIFVSGGVFACVGGGGPLSDGMTTWDPTPSSLERADTTREAPPGFREVAPSSREPVGASTEPGPGAQGVGSGAGGFDCSGTYTCVESGDDDEDEVAFISLNGLCTVQSGNSVLILGSDGTLLLNGKNVGSWQGSGGGLTVTTEDGTVSCTKGSRGRGQGDGPGNQGGSGGPGGSNRPPSPGSGGGGSGGSANPTPTVPPDAG